MYYLIFNTYGEYPHIVDDIDKFYIDNEMLHAHSITKGNINLWREAWDVLHLTYYPFEDYIFNQEAKNGKNQIY